MLLVQLLMLSAAEWGGDQSALCELAGKDIVSRSSSGLAQVATSGILELRAVSRRVHSQPTRVKAETVSARQLLSTKSPRTLLREVEKAAAWGVAGSGRESP